MTKNNELEIIEAKSEVIEEPGVEKVTLKTPITFEGTEYRFLKLRLGDLTGADIEAAEIEFMGSSPSAGVTPLKEMSKGFLAIVAAKSLGLPVEFMKKLKAPDYSQVTTKVQIFLMSGE